MKSHWFFTGFSWRPGSHTGIDARNVRFAAPVFVGDINVVENAVPVFVIGNAMHGRIMSGDLLQANGRAVRVVGIVPLNFVGTTSHGASSRMVST